MMTWCLLLLLLGAAFLIVEMFIPGFGVFGLGGIGAMIAAAVLAVLYVPFGWLFVLAEIVSLAALLYCMWRYIRKKQLHGKLIMEDTLDEVREKDRGSLIGKEGLVLTPLKPFGEADFGGDYIEVASDGAFIEKGARVKITEVQKHKITVREIHKN